MSTGKTVTIGFIPILLIALVFGTYLGFTLGPSSSPSTTIASSSVYASTAQAVDSTLGLNLVLEMNSTSIQSGETLGLNATIFNVLSTVNNVSGSSSWAIPSLPTAASFPCPTYLYYQVYPGYYSADNVSQSGTPLQVAPVYQYLSCPIFQRSYYLFQPRSSEASIPVGYYTTNSSTYYQTTRLSVSGFLYGNYSRSYNASVFTPNGADSPPPFRTGVYTLVAGDEWGQIVILHFVVTPSTPATLQEKVPLLGICTVVSYLLPDTEQVLFTLVTTTFLNTTTYYNSIYGAVYPTIQTLGTTTFTSTTYVASTTSYGIVNTSTNTNVVPSSLWSVTNCTFG